MNNTNIYLSNRVSQLSINENWVCHLVTMNLHSFAMSFAVKIVSLIEQSFTFLKLIDKKLHLYQTNFYIKL